MEFAKVGESSIGYISIAEVGQHVPFEIKRVFWTYFTPESVERGGHAHHSTEMLLLAAAGRILVRTEMPDGYTESFPLDQPFRGLYIPKYCWHTMRYSHNAVQLVLASSKYEKEDYIRDYDVFRKL